MLWLKATIARSAVRYHLKNAPALQGFLPIGATRFLGQNYPGALVGVAVSKRMTPNAAIGLALAAVIAVEGSALAQYDRDGRYVPSPMGVPQDVCRPDPDVSRYAGRSDRDTPFTARGRP